jgi:hypothetical protein
MVWMNERRQVKIYNTLVKVEKDVVSNVNPFTSKENNDTDNHCVHMQGLLEQEEILKDATFNINFENCVKMKRTVEMFQW